MKLFISLMSIIGLLSTPLMAQTAQSFEGSWLDQSSGLRIDFGPNHMGMITLADGNRHAFLYDYYPQYSGLQFMFDGYTAASGTADVDYTTYIPSLEGNMLSLFKMQGAEMLGTFTKEGPHQISASDLRTIQQLLAEEYAEVIGKSNVAQAQQPEVSSQAFSQTSAQVQQEHSPAASSDKFPHLEGIYGQALNGYYRSTSHPGAWVDLSPDGSFRGVGADNPEEFSGLYHYYPNTHFIRFITTNGYCADWTLYVKGNRLEVQDNAQPQKWEHYVREGNTRQTSGQAKATRKEAHYYFFTGGGKDQLYVALDGVFESATGDKLDLHTTGTFVYHTPQGDKVKGVYRLDRTSAYMTLTTDGHSGSGKMIPKGQSILISDEQSKEENPYRYTGPSQQTLTQATAIMNLAQKVAAQQARQNSALQSKYHNA
ncbi:MAG: hypothetical protein AAFP92_31085, partial [Bacteroidota bacterium]